MNRLWTALALAAAMVGLCCVLTFCTVRATDRFTDRLERLSTAEAGEWDAGALASGLQEDWERCEEWMSLHIHHSELEEVTRALARMEICWQTGEYEMFRMACDEALVALEHLRQESRPLLKNII